jgi:hypothetical protein
MIANWLRDAQLLPVLATFAASGYYGYLDHVASATLDGEGGDVAEERAVLMVALHFETWRTLTRRQGLDGQVAARLMAGQLNAGVS